jgi:hypothetical protein
MRPVRCWGVFREREHSPGRETDDAQILRLTGKNLETKGFEVTLKESHELDERAEAPAAVFLMCEQLPALRRLQAWEAASVVHVNRPLAVLNTYRDRMIAHFAEAGVPFVKSRLVVTGTPLGEVPGGLWVKRGDVHNTQEGDVVFAATPDDVRAAVAGLAARDIPHAVLQPHVDGDSIKFYGVGTGAGREGAPPWFQWFYHRDQTLSGCPFDPKRLGRLVRQAAAALGLEIYGGDAIATPAGDLVLLDLNAWPSFALYREEAAAAIASYLELRFAGGRQ